eukprot:366011-Chlamydomonas_euryale.AAC.3
MQVYRADMRPCHAYRVDALAPMPRIHSGHDYAHATHTQWACMRTCHTYTGSGNAPIPHGAMRRHEYDQPCVCMRLLALGHAMPGTWALGCALMHVCLWSVHATRPCMFSG